MNFFYSLQMFWGETDTVRLYCSFYLAELDKNYLAICGDHNCLKLSLEYRNNELIPFDDTYFVIAHFPQEDKTGNGILL
jgi:hypothetical protein